MCSKEKSAFPRAQETAYRWVNPLFDQNDPVYAKPENIPIPRLFVRPEVLLGILYNMLGIYGVGDSATIRS